MSIGGSGALMHNTNSAPSGGGGGGVGLLNSNGVGSTVTPGNGGVNGIGMNGGLGGNNATSNLIMQTSSY